MTAFVFSDFWAASTVSAEVSIAVSPVLLAPIAGIVTTLTHGFYCWRISSHRKSRLISLPIMMVSLLQLVSVTYLDVTNGLFPSNESIAISNSSVQVSFQLSPWLVIWLGSSVVCDLAITICMILILRPSKSHFGSNKSTLVKLTRLTIETGLVTTAAALLELILGIVYQQSMDHIAVFYALSKLYANCLLATLNFRLVLKDQSDPNVTTTSIVWDDATLNTQSLQEVYQLSHIAHIVPRVETDVDVVTDLDKTSLRKNSSVEDQSSEMYEFSDKSTLV
ncbi:hypothetical protein V8E55_009662 [Tylopilus felleus]